MSATRYFRCKPGEINGFNFTILPEGDLLPITIQPNSKVIYPAGCNMPGMPDVVILHVLLSDKDIQDISEVTDAEDPLSVEAVLELDIAQLYLGRTIQDVLFAYPALDAEYESGEDADGFPTYTNVLLPHVWGGVPDE